jgi:branched-chain amino acid transport system permease protein
MKRGIVIVAVWCVALIIGLMVKNEYYLTVGTITAFLALFSQSWNLQSGFTGNLSVGHSVFVAVPIYVTLILFQQVGIPPVLGGLAGILLAVAIAAAIGGATLRLSGPYFALATLSASAVVLGIILHFSGLTNGPSGISIPFSKTAALNLEFIDVHTYYIIAITLLAAVTAFVSLARHSRLGYYAAALKCSEETAAAAGVRVARVKVTVFCLSAALTASGGIVYVFFIGFADPTFLAGPTLSIEIALIAVIGGLNYLAGPIIGAAFFELVDVWANARFGAAGGWSTMILGFSVVLLVLTEPRGLCELAVKTLRYATSLPASSRRRTGDRSLKGPLA